MYHPKTNNKKSVFHPDIFPPCSLSRMLHWKTSLASPGLGDYLSKFSPKNNRGAFLFLSSRVSAILSKNNSVVAIGISDIFNNRIIRNLTTNLKTADPGSSWGVIYGLPLRNLIFSRHLRINKNWIQKYPKLGTNFVRFSRMSISPQRMCLRMAFQEKIKPRGSLQNNW
jgi:hypothetical protein